MIAISNVKKVEYPDIQHIACHIPHPLGNPFVIGKDGNREDVISKYKVFLNEQIKNGNKNIIEALREIEARYCEGKKLCLDCYCYPEGCHTEMIRACVLNNVANRVFGDYASKNITNLHIGIRSVIDTKQAEYYVAEWASVGIIKNILGHHYEYQSLGFRLF